MRAQELGDGEGHALDLVGHGGAGGRNAVTGDSGPLLDAQAKAAYKRRLDEIDADIVEAESLGDLARAARAAQADAEREFLIGELSRAFGLGVAIVAPERRPSGLASR